MLILRPGQEILKMILEHLVVPESKEVLKTKPKPKQKTTHFVGVMSNGPRNKLKEFSVAKPGTI